MDMFLQQEGAKYSKRHLVGALKKVQAPPSPNNMDDVEQEGKYTAFLLTYERSCDDTRACKHGGNARFWRNFIDMVDIYMLFNRAIRTNDVGSLQLHAWEND